MVEPERDDKVEQEARSEENKQEAAQLLKLQRQELLTQLVAPSNVTGLLNLYVVFVGTVVAFGVFAFYTGHKTIQEIIFFACPILFFVLPIGAIWYLRPLFTTKVGLSKRILGTLKQYPISKFLARLGNKRFIRLFSLVVCATMIADAIYSFPKHPRFSLLIVVIYLTLCFASASLWIWDEVLKATMVDIYGLIRDLVDMIDNVMKFALSTHEFIKFTEQSHSEVHKTTAVALRALNDAVQELGKFVTKPHQVEGKEPSEP
jgi:hypothetical protein